MIQQIISHTPFYVWALLAFLVYRGVLAAKDREVSLLKLFIIPVVMLVISLAGMNGHGVLGVGVWGVWLTGMLATVAVTWTAGNGEIVINRAAGTVLQRGSWAPLVLMLAIFCHQVHGRGAVGDASGVAGADVVRRRRQRLVRDVQRRLHRPPAALCGRLCAPAGGGIGLI